MFPESELKQMYAEWDKKDQGEFLEKVAKRFNWTTGEAYIATEFLFRPTENYN